MTSFMKSGGNVMNEIRNNLCVLLWMFLHIPEKSQVEIIVQKVSPPNVTKTPEQQLREALIAAGLSQADEVQDDALTPLSEEMRVQLAERLSTVGPLSDLIIQEREADCC